MRIALFGGSFDPPHRGHIAVADAIVGKSYADAVWYVPCYSHPFQKSLTPPEHRLNMLKLIRGHKICTHEIEMGEVSYSIRTLEYMAKKYPKDEFCWIIGSDQLHDFPKWHRYEDILHHYGVLVYPRSGYSAANILPGMKLLEDVEPVDVSSSEVRNLLRSHKPVSGLTSTEIATYIKENKLYEG